MRRGETALFLVYTGRVRWVVSCLTMAVAGGLLAGVSAAGDGQPVFSDPLLKDRHTVDANASKRIGDDYACAVVTAPESDPSRQLLINVTSEAAVTQAEQLRLELDNPDSASVEVVGKRLRASTIERIRRRAQKAAPAGVGIGVGEGKVYHRRCPRVELIIAPACEASRRAERWTRRFRRRHGSDRVVVNRRRLQLLGGAPDREPARRAAN